VWGARAGESAITVETHHIQGVRYVDENLGSTSHPVGQLGSVGVGVIGASTGVYYHRSGLLIGLLGFEPKYQDSGTKMADR